MIQPLEFIITVMLKVAATNSIHELIYSLMELQLHNRAKTKRAKRSEEMLSGLRQMNTRYFKTNDNLIWSVVNL